MPRNNQKTKLIMCNNNGKTLVEYLTPVPGGAADNATYLLALDHFTCGNRKLCTQEVFPVTADLKFTPLGAPVSVGNGSFCQEVLCSGTVASPTNVRPCCNVTNAIAITTTVNVATA